MTHADSIDLSYISIRAIFPGHLGKEAEDMLDELVERCDPPIRVVQVSTWALKAGGLVHCAVCWHVRGVRKELPHSRHGLCSEHAGWKIFYRHHSWDAFEQHDAAVEHLKIWLSKARKSRRPKR